MNKSDLNNLSEEERFLSACPLCNTRYEPEEAKIVEEKDDAYLLYTICEKCGSNIVATLTTNSLGVSSIGLVTDLTYEDVVLFKDGDGIFANDVVELYEHLKANDGDMKFLTSEA
ncbi:MAG: hypothetical protein ABIE68_01430 [bacterium]